MRVGETPSPLVARILTGPIQVADLAQTARLSVSRLPHLFREQVGWRPGPSSSSSDSSGPGTCSS